MWNVINDVIFRMTWLEAFFQWILFDLLPLDAESTIGGILLFFLYDAVKIIVLLILLIYLVSWIQSYFPPERTAAILARYHGFKGNLLGALFGTITPFCSCSSIPIFIGFTKAGLPIGVTFSFLISSPLVDLASFVILLSFLGWKIAIAYVIVGIILAILGGWIMDKTNMEQHLEDYIKDMKPSETQQSKTSLERSERHQYAWDQVLDILRRVWPYILIGVGIGSIIHNLIPEDIIQTIIGSDNPFSVILATIVGVPMYADIFGTIPIAEALLGKGVGVGTILAFMMAVTALSLPSLVLLRQVAKPKLIVVFTTIVTIGIIIIGYTFNFIVWIGG